MIKLKSLLKESSQKRREQLVKLFIYSVWRYMPKEDRYNDYDFSLYMDNEESLQILKEKIIPY